MSEPLPLFPLKAVLFPGAAMDLRIFEPRYLDLVRECGRSGGGFGISLIVAGEEVGAPAMPAAYGTEARIEDFGTTPDGLLSLRVRGHRRYHALHTRVRDNGLVMADVQWLDDEAGSALRPEHALLAELLRRILLQVGGEHADAPPARFDDAAWVAWRLAEVLPMRMHDRQALLQQNDPHRRLQALLDRVSDDDAEDAGADR